MMKTFKKFIAIMLTLVFVATILPIGVLADALTTKSVVIPVQNAGTCHMQSGDNPSSLSNQDKGPRVATARAGDKKGNSYGQFDLSGYEEILENESTRVTYSVRLGGDWSSKCNNLKVQLFNDESDYEDTSITYNQATALGLNGTGAMTIFDKNDGIEQDDVTSSAEVDRAGLVAVLRSGTDNSIVCYTATTTNTSPVFFRPYWSDTGLTIEYDVNDIDDEAYVNAIKNEFSWADISTQNIDALESNLTLPSKYRGADVTWASGDESVVTSDGMVTVKKASKSTILTATFNYKGAESEVAKTATKAFTVTTASEEMINSPLIKTINAKWDRSKNKNSASNPSLQQSSYVIQVSKGGGDNNRYAYGQYDLKGYEEILGNPSTKVSYKLRAGVGFGDSKASSFKIQLFNDESDYDPATVTYNKAAELGLHGDGFYTMFERTDSTEVKNYTSSAEIDTQALNSALRSGPTNSLVTYNISTTVSALTYYEVETDNEGLTISYYASEIDEEGYFNDIKEEFAWELLTDDLQSALVNDLPTYFRGATITWSADVDGVVSSDGKITQYIGKSNSAKLTANVEYKGFEFSESFDVTVPEEALKSVVIPLKYGTYITSKSPANPQGSYNASFYSRFMYSAGMYSGVDDRQVYLQWDFSDALLELSAARSISINLKSVIEHTQAGAGSKFSVLPDGYEDWTEATLSYDMAVEKGIYTAPAVASVDFSPLKKSGEFQELTSSAEILNGIRKSIADNPDDGIVNFRWEALGQSPTAYRLSDNVKTYFTITLYYYESELVSDDAFVNSKVDSMPWGFVSGQEIDKVIANLSLPATFYGADVTWSSNNEDVITSSGEVIPSDVDTVVTLTATVNGLTKDFEVVVPANTNYVLDSSKGNYVNAYVWAKEACDSCALVVATYIDDTLVGIDVKDTDFTLEKGENFIWTKLSGAGDGKTVKIMLVNNMESLTPLAVSK